MKFLEAVWWWWGRTNTAWCSETGSLTSLDACSSGAFSDAREPISLHQAVPKISILFTLRMDTCGYLFFIPLVNFTMWTICLRWKCIRLWSYFGEYRQPVFCGEVSSDGLSFYQCTWDWALWLAEVYTVSLCFEERKILEPVWDVLNFRLRSYHTSNWAVNILLDVEPRLALWDMFLTVLG